MRKILTAMAAAFVIGSALEAQASPQGITRGGCVRPPVVSVEELKKLCHPHYPIPTVIVILPPGTTLPVYCDLKSDFFTVRSTGTPSHYISLTQTMFMLVNQGAEPLFSVDMVSWQPFDRYFSGSLSFTVGSNGWMPLPAPLESEPGVAEGQEGV